MSAEVYPFRRPSMDDVLDSVVAEHLARRDDGTCLKLSEVAARLSVHPDTVTKLVRDGDLPLVSIRGAKRVKLVDLLAFQEAHRA